MAIWSPPGQSPGNSNWRYDLGKKSFTPPGVPSPKGNTQVNLPADWNASSKRDFHVLASPAGSQAPVEHINYTPETGEISGRGQPAPIDKLNYTILPSAGAGHTSAGGRGGGGIGGGGGAGQDMGAGAGAMPGQREPFAGTPPLSSSPTLTGPSPTLNRAQPNWGGAVPMGQRMGMGQSNAFNQGDSGGGGGGGDGGDGQPAGPPDSSRPALTQPAFDGSGNHIGDYVIHQPTTALQNPTVTWVPDPKYKGNQTPTTTTQKLDNGSVITITSNPADPNNPNVHVDAAPDANTVARAEADAQTAQLNLKVAQQKLDLANATSDVDKAQKQADLDKTLQDLQTAKTNQAEAQQRIDAANRPGGASSTHPDKPGPNGNIWTWDPTKSTYVDTNFKPGEDASSWTNPYTAPDGSTQIYNPQTQEIRTIAPPDPNKNYNTPIHMGSQWKVWNTQTKSYDVVGQDDPQHQLTWRDGKLISTDLATNKTSVVYDAGPTIAETDAHTQSIDAHNQAVESLKTTQQQLQQGRITLAQARVTMEQDIQNLMNPKAYQVGSLIFAGPGQTINVPQYNPQTGQMSTTQAVGPPGDPSLQGTVDQIRSQLSDLNYGDPNKQAQPTTPSTTPTQSTQPSTPTQDLQPSATVKPLAPAGTAGVAGPGGDPNLAGTTESMRLLNPAPLDPGQAPTPFTQSGLPEGSSRGNDPNLLTTPGGGNEMGAGAVGTPGGWVPRPSPFSRATGTGFLQGSMGTGQEAPMTLPPPQLPGGHQPGQDVLPTPPGIFTPPMQPKPNVNTGPGPGAQGQTTDKGVNWTPQMADLVKQKVNESLKDLLGWPKLGSPEHEMSPDPSNQQGYQGIQGVQGGHSTPETTPVDPTTGQTDPSEPTSDITSGDPTILRLEQILPGVKDTTELDDLENTPDIKNNPQAMKMIEDTRRQLGTMGTGQGQPPMNPQQPNTPQTAPSAGPGWQPPQQKGNVPDPRQLLQQAQSGKQKLPQWIQMLIRMHPELLQMMTGQGGPPQAGGPPSPGPPLPAASGAPSPPMGGGQDQPPAGPGAPPPQAPSPGGAPMQPPVPPQDVAGIGHRFGQQMDVGEPQHSGVDLQAPEGTPTQSPVDGFVTDVQNNPQGLGITVVIQGQDGSQHKLGHLKGTKAYKGMQVARGQDLGSPVGSTGLTTGAHLHWGVQDPSGQPSDPTQALGPMAQMPPVPGTEQMGPPGGTGAPTPPPMGGGQQAVKPAGWNPQKPRAKRRWGKPDPSKQQGVSPRMGQGHMSNARNPQGFGVGQDASGAPTNYQSPDYQRGYQDGMQASAKPGTPPLFTPGLAQPIPGAPDASQGGQQQGGGQ